MKQVLAILFATAFTWLVAWSAGKCLFQALRIKLYRSEERFLCFVGGAACLSLTVFVLTALRLAYTGVFLAAGMALVVVAWRRGALKRSTKRLPALPPGWRAAFFAVYSVYACLYVANALIPDISADGLAYHVALPARYLREHGFPANPGFFIMYLSEGVEMLYLFAFAFGRHSAAAMVHLVFTLLTPLGMLDYGRRAGRPLAGAVGALLFFLSPIVGRDGTSPYVDVAAGSVVFATFYALEIWREERAGGLPALAGLLAGFAYAIKYSAGVAVPCALGYVLFHLWKWRQPVWRVAGALALGAGIMMTPWMLKNAVITGNPLAPFANRLFPNPAMYVSMEDSYRQAMGNWLAVRLWETPLQVTLYGATLQGLVGPVFLLAPLILFSLRSPLGRRLALAALFSSLSYPSAIACRFLIPALPFVSLGLALTLTACKPLALALVLAHAVLSWPAVLLRYTEPYAWCLQEAPWRIALRKYPEEEFLRAQVGGYTMGRMLEEQVPAGEVVFSFPGFQGSYQSREVMWSWASALGVRLGDALKTPVNTGLAPTWRHGFRFPPATVPRIRLVQTQPSDTDNWTASEIRVYRQGVELPRQPNWRLKARPNPWDAPLAFDNNPVTRWTSGEPYRPGMYIQLDFGAQTLIDEVRVECSRDQPQMRMRLEVERAPGRWQALEAQTSLTDAPPHEHLRHAAIEYLKDNHLRWLLIHETDSGASDFFRRRAAWGITLVASEGRYRLYRVD